MLLDHEQTIARSVVTDAFETGVVRLVQRQRDGACIGAAQRAGQVRHLHHHQRLLAFLGQHQQVVTQIGHALDVFEALQRVARDERPITAQRQQLLGVVDHGPQVTTTLVVGQPGKVVLHRCHGQRIDSRPVFRQPQAATLPAVLMPGGFQCVEQPLIQMQRDGKVQQAEQQQATGPAQGAQRRQSSQLRDGEGSHGVYSLKSCGQAARDLLQLNEGRNRDGCVTHYAGTFRPSSAALVPPLCH